MFWTIIYFFISYNIESNKQPPMMMMMTTTTMMMRMNNNNNIIMSRIATLRNNRRPLLLLNNYVVVTSGRNNRRLRRQKRDFSSSSSIVKNNDYVSSSSSIMKKSSIATASSSSSSSSSSSVSGFWPFRYCHDYDTNKNKNNNNIDYNDSKTQPISTSQNKLTLSSSSNDRRKTTNDTTTTSTSTDTVKTKDQSESNNNNNNNENQKKMDDDGKNDDDTPTKMQMIFPWRHQTTLLNRCQPGTTENLHDSHLLTTTSVSPESPTLHAITTAYFFLDVPWYQFIFWSTWKDDLADSISFAFTQGVACLLSNLSQDPLESIVKDTYEINFHKIVESYNKSDNEGKVIIDNKEEDRQIPLEPMMETKLISLYSKARDDLNSRLLTQQKTGEEDATTTTKIEICLKTVPVSAELYSLYSIPYLSRNNIRSDKKLHEFYKQMIDKPSSERAPDLFQLRTTHLETGVMESTVICQILIWCNELFYVKDVTSDKVLQGNMDTKGQNVPHLIRMEKIVRTEKNPNGSFHNQQGDWIITDIDDLLGGNLIV